MKLSRLLTLAGGVLASGAAVLMTGACTETQTTTVTDTLVVARFNPPKDSVNGMLGYFAVATKQTQCGQCHAGQQTAWATTKHAVAWASLQSSGHAASYCYGCHSVSQIGNSLSDSTPAGYLKVADSTYFDVQCENCHGPGAAPGNSHAAAPGIANRPLARLMVPADTAAAVTSGTCAACHQGTHEPYTQEWSQSAHATVQAPAIGNASCMGCHEGRNTLKAWGVNTNYVEANDVVTVANAMPVTCGICHDPHSTVNGMGQLRWAIDDQNPANNLCMKCHLRGQTPTDNGRGPHAPQGAVLLGSAGWWPTAVDTITATHGNVAVNTRLCAGCHVNRVTVTDSVGGFVFQSVGHLFSPDACVDASGKPTAADCARPGDAAYVSGSRYFLGCQAAGCHNTAAQAEQAMASQRAVVGALADALWKDVNGNTTLFTTSSAQTAGCKPAGTATSVTSFKAYDAGDLGLLTELSAAQADTAFCSGDGVVSVAEGVLFNVRMVGENRYGGHADGSFGVHNPLLIQQLLASSVTAMQNRYGVFAPPEIQQLVAQVNQKVAAYKASRGQLSAK